jgi:hypothetical protein
MENTEVVSNMTYLNLELLSNVDFDETYCHRLKFIFNDFLPMLPPTPMLIETYSSARIYAAWG